MKLIQERNKSVTYKEARVYLDELSKYGSVLGLENMKELLVRLGNPQEDLKFIHISGTNGKGSVLAYLSTILSGAGYRTGRYISPTLFSYRERIQVDEKEIEKEISCPSCDSHFRGCERYGGAACGNTYDFRGGDCSGFSLF